jgi:hypothetical protein
LKSTNDGVGRLAKRRRHFQLAYSNVVWTLVLTLVSFGPAAMIATASTTNWSKASLDDVLAGGQLPACKTGRSALKGAKRSASLSLSRS